MGSGLGKNEHMLAITSIFQGFFSYQLLHQVNNRVKYPSYVQNNS